ncbi:hypothetical protein BDM02DRAFT_1652432 [Thelephora ganbajun]|uniref:Uncharacterized protein n=1 Tax=Thelephora ganbajun TaxID=370292 RepID=A0ACB6ZWC3_THEGA|nr:hypothetical protein BDM02DRAFT_1652432 [Thelephora ganbajun]
MSSEIPAILRENPKAEDESWEAWGEKLAEKHKTPTATPNLPLVPGFDKLPETWLEYGTQWKNYYNAKVAGQPIATSGPVLPALPIADASGEEWATWGKAVSDAWTAYAIEKDVDLAKVLEGLKSPEPPADGNWGAYASQWSEYGKQVEERFQAALAAKSA